MTAIFIFISGATLLVYSAERLISSLVGISRGLAISVFLLAIIFTGIEFDDIVLGIALNLEGDQDVALGLVLGTAVSFSGIVLAIGAILTPTTFRIPREYIVVFALSPLTCSSSRSARKSRPSTRSSSSFCSSPGSPTWPYASPSARQRHSAISRSSRKPKSRKSSERRLTRCGLRPPTRHSPVDGDGRSFRGLEIVEGAEEQEDQEPARTRTAQTTSAAHGRSFHDVEIVEQAERAAAAPVTTEAVDTMSLFKRQGRWSGWINLGLAVIAICGIVIGAATVSDATDQILDRYFIEGTVFGATIVTAVLCIEDLFLTVRPIRRGVPEIGIGNVIFSVTAKLGIVVLAGGSVAIGSSVLHWHLPALIVLTGIAAGFMWTGRLKRWHGVVLLALYAAYWVISYAVYGGAPLDD